MCAKIVLPLALLVLACGCHKEEQRPSAAGSGGGIVSAEKTSFDEVTAKLDKGGNFYLYLSTEQTLSGMASKMTSLSNFVGTIPAMAEQSQTVGRFFDFAGGWLKDSGIEHVSGVGMSSIAREPNFYYSKLIVHHYLGENEGVIWSVFGKKPHPLHELDLLPETTALAIFSDLDVPLAWKDIRKHLEQLNIPAVTAGLQQWPQQFHRVTGLDFDKVLGSLGEDYGIILTLDNQNKISLPTPNAAMEIPNPGLAIVAKVDSDVIFNRVDELCKGNPLVMRVDDSGLKMRTMKIPLPLPVDLRPSIARSGDYLLLATSDTLVREILAVKAGKKKGFKSTPEFARLSQGIPGEGNNFLLVADQFVKTAMQIQQQTLTNKGSMTSAQVESFQHVFNNATNYGTYSVGVNGSEGWEGYANGSQSMESMIFGGAFGIGAAAAIAIPTMMKAHAVAQNVSSAPQGNLAAPAPQASSLPNLEAAQYNHILTNLRALQAAKQKWATAKGKAEGDTVTMDDLASYLPDGTIQPVADEEYDPQPVGALATAKLAHDLHGHAAGSEISAPPARKTQSGGQ